MAKVVKRARMDASGCGLSFAPESRLVLATYVGARTFQSALKLIQMTALVALGVPVFLSDGFSSYLPALLAVYHQMKSLARTGKPGRPKNPIQEAHPDLAYAQLVKQKQQGRLKTLTQRVCLGAARLAALGIKISTSLVERFNLTLRHAPLPLPANPWASAKTVPSYDDGSLFIGSTGFCVVTPMKREA